VSQEITGASGAPLKGYDSKLVYALKPHSINKKRIDAVIKKVEQRARKIGNSVLS
jgi:hypothetical protein